VFEPSVLGNSPGMAEVQPMTSDPTANAEKDPNAWGTREEPMTGAQASYLNTLAQDNGREVPERLTKAQASKLVDKLQLASTRVGR
jgi:hypothetical protein